jgi:hypothetical protein
MPSNTVDSLSYENISESDPIEALLSEICIVFANGNSFCARLVSIHNKNELWFESKSGQQWMVRRQAVAGIRPLHHAPGRRS